LDLVPSMAEPPPSLPSMASPDHEDDIGANTGGVLRPPPLRSFQENNSESRSDLNFTLRI
ncbi:hypothetical protein A2U01_0058169, partial [Trifolium medium]|nr:hypothetical protein [Trifolium medium]